MRLTPFHAGLALAVCVVAPAMAQTSNSGVSLGPSQQVAQPTASPVAPQVEHLFGDWGGIRTDLGNMGIDVLFDVTTEFAGNVSGGVKQGATFASQEGLEVDLDWQKLAGLAGLTTHVIMINRSGSSDSALFGDRLLPVQEIYGSGGDVAVHLVSAYMEQKLFDGALSISFGRMNVENDFASSPLYCNFMNNSLCGDPKALPAGDIGHSAYPDAVWAVQARVRPAPHFYVQSGVYEVNQGLYSYTNFRTGFKLDDSQDSGVYLPLEGGWEPVFGKDGLPGHYKIGFGYDTSGTYTDFSIAPITTATPRHTGNTQVWALADQMLLRQGKGDEEGVIAMAGFVHNDPVNTEYAEQYFAGVLNRGFWAARPQDAVGLLFSYNTVSGYLGKVEAAEQELGLPYTSPGTGVQTHEMIFEVNYDIHVARGVNFQPEFEYVIRPNAQGNIPDAAVLGFKAHVSF
jgi:porin